VKTLRNEVRSAVDKLENHVEDFESEDDLGLYIETQLRPTSKDPGQVAEKGQIE